MKMLFYLTLSIEHFSFNNEKNVLHTNYETQPLLNAQ